MAHIDAQDRVTGELILKRLQNAIDAIAMRPGIGTPTGRPSLRRFSIPKTGHTIEYRTTLDAITIVNWVRHKKIRKV
jgi:hypothetical protein